MAFFSKCVFNGSSPRIWRRLSGLGLKRDPLCPVLSERTATNPVRVYIDNGIYFNVKDLEPLPSGCIDCGDNDRLFFALAALRDDSDYNQTFIFDNRYRDPEKPMRFWFTCKTDNVEDSIVNLGSVEDCTKATEQELIYHYSGRNDEYDEAQAD